MKKYILLCAGILFTIISNAQSVKYGLTLGANFTKVDGNGIKSSYYPGFIGGGFARIPLSEKWQLEPEVFVNFAHTKKLIISWSYITITAMRIQMSQLN